MVALLAHGEGGVRVVWAEACVTSSPGCGLRCLPCSGRVSCDRPARRPHGPPPPPVRASRSAGARFLGLSPPPPSSLAARGLPDRRAAPDPAPPGERIPLSTVRAPSIPTPPTPPHR